METRIGRIVTDIKSEARGLAKLLQLHQVLLHLV